jgi:hypothetical protein
VHCDHRAREEIGAVAGEDVSAEDLAAASVEDELGQTDASELGRGEDRPRDHPVVGLDPGAVEMFATAIGAS